MLVPENVEINICFLVMLLCLAGTYFVRFGRPWKAGC